MIVLQQNISAQVDFPLALLPLALEPPRQGLNVLVVLGSVPPRLPRGALFLVPGPVRALARLRAVARLAAPSTDKVARLGKIDSFGTVSADAPPDP